MVEELKVLKKITETHAGQDKIKVERMGDEYEVRAVQWGGFNVSFEKALADFDVTPYLKGLPDDMDQSPHWGYVFKGKVIVRYKDHEEIINAGEAYYIAPGHTALTTKGTEVVEFSPLNEFEKTMAVAMKNMQEMATKKRE